jgi:uncharacterized protein Yka (UPF0111/DUF47 family)
MSIDFAKKEAREGYLQSKLDDLLDGINASYGQTLMSRLEATVDDFNKEVDKLMGSLKKNSEEKEKLIQQIKAGGEPRAEERKTATESVESTDESRELSEWEKRLEGISKD